MVYEAASNEGLWDRIGAGILPLFGGPDLRGACRSPLLSAPAAGTASVPALSHLRRFPSSSLRDCVHTRRTSHALPSRGWEAVSLQSGPRPVHPRVDQRRVLLLHGSPLSLPAKTGDGGGGPWMNGTDVSCGFSCAAFPWMGPGWRGWKKRTLRLQGPIRHRIGGSTGAHVRGDLCVVFGGGCACHVDKGVCLCV